MKKAVAVVLTLILAGVSVLTSCHRTDAYTNVYFDYSKDIAALNAKNESFTTPAAADIGISVADEKGATGVAIVPASSGGGTDFYLNALVAGNTLTFSGAGVTAVTVKAGDAARSLPVQNGQFALVPRSLSAAEPLDEVITVTKADGSAYNIHTLNEYLPSMDITTGGVKPVAGVYSFTVDKVMLRVDTEGNIVYYRNMAHLGDHSALNFKPQDTPDGRFYTVCVELAPDMGGIGFTNGMVVIMDENYKEINYVTLSSNEEKHHTHGEGYLDEHEFQLMGRDHWICLSYTPLRADNLPGGGIGGGNTAYVQANIIQEVQNGKVIHEYNMADLPELYAAARENTDFAGSSGSGTPDDYMDYTHVNSIAVDPKDGNLIVSMRSQYAVYKLSRETGKIIWALGGALNSFSGLEAFYDAKGNLFIGQHYAIYIDSTVAGGDSTVSVFDNHTSYAGNTTRTFVIKLDENGKTASAKVINGAELDQLTPKKHWSTHCGSFEMETKDTCIMGWGSNVTLNGNVKTIPTHALLTDYHMGENTVAFELSVERNSHYLGSKDFCFSYRVYKNAD